MSSKTRGQMVQCTFYISAAQHERADRMSAALCVPVAHMVRAGLERTMNDIEQMTGEQAYEYLGKLGVECVWGSRGK